jgi:hypothetical protein
MWKSVSLKKLRATFHLTSFAPRNLLSESVKISSFLQVLRAKLYLASRTEGSLKKFRERNFLSEMWKSVINALIFSMFKGNLFI